MRYFILDERNSSDTGEGHSFADTLSEVQDILSDRASEYAEDGRYRAEDWFSQVKVYTVGEEIPVSLNTRVTVSVGKENNIPAPNPGETVGEYARRITGA